MRWCRRLTSTTSTSTRGSGRRATGPLSQWLRATLVTAAPILERLRSTSGFSRSMSAASDAVDRSSRRTRWPTSPTMASRCSTTPAGRPVTSRRHQLRRHGGAGARGHRTRPGRTAHACSARQPGGVGGSSYPLHELAALSPRSARDVAAAGRHPLLAKWFADHPPRRHDHPGPSRSGGGTESDEQLTGEKLQLAARAAHDLLGSPRPHQLSDAGRLWSLRRHRAGQEQRVDGRAHPDPKLEVFEGGHMFFIQDKTASPGSSSSCAET